jgi:hypothetical protein
MSSVLLPQAEKVRQRINYDQAVDFARQFVAREANDRGDDLSEDELELATAIRAAQILRRSV